MICDGEMEKGDGRETVEKKGVKETQRASYEQWKKSRRHKTDIIQPIYHIQYAKAMNLRFLNY